MAENAHTGRPEKSDRLESAHGTALTASGRGGSGSDRERRFDQPVLSRALPLGRCTNRALVLRPTRTSQSKAGTSMGTPTRGFLGRATLHPTRNPTQSGDPR
jgi:hypothetical protein